jgi:hypothetical protein
MDIMSFVFGIMTTIAVEFIVLIGICVWACSKNKNQK